MRKLFLGILFVSAILFAMVSSCKKEEEVIDDPVDTLVVDESSTGTKNSMQADNVYDNTISSVIVSCDGNGSKSINTCATVTLVPSDLTTYPKTLTIDYGTSGCTVGGYPVSGKIVATLSGKIREIGTVISISFDNYSVDTITVSGTVSLSVDDYSAINKTITISTSTTGGVLTTPSGTINYTGSKSIKYYFNTLTDYTDNEFEIAAGSSTNVTALDGNTYATEVLEKIYIQPCTGVYQVVDGLYEITSTELLAPVQINFGDGECDNLATVSTTISITYGNQTFEQDYSYPITLP